VAGDTSGVLQLATNGSTTAVTVDASQNVGIGTASPATTLDVSVPSASTQVSSTTGTNRVFSRVVNSGGNFYFGIDSSTGGLFGNGNYARNIYSDGAYPMVFATNATERMRIDSSGNLLVGTAGGGGAQVRWPYNSASANSRSWAIRNDWDAYGDVAFIQSTTQTGTTFTAQMKLDPSGGLILTGSTAQKATGTTWSNPSDVRLKDNVRDYGKGIAELMQVRVREWEYNGKGGTTEGMKGLGVIADEVMTVLPDTVENYDAKLNADDEETTAIKKFDATEITWLLVKTVQEQQTIINDLKARITALEGAA
jgi:hypothetical protein